MLYTDVERAVRQSTSPAGEHVVDGVVVEEAAPPEEAEHAALQRALETVDVVGGETPGLTRRSVMRPPRP